MRDVEIIGFNNPEDLRGQILDFFDVDSGSFSQEQLGSLDEFCSWLRKSIVFDKKSKKWKYKNLEKEERGSFTFPVTGMSAAHLLHGKDINVPWLHFAFDDFRGGVMDFIAKSKISYQDEAEEYTTNHMNRIKKIQGMILGGKLDIESINKMSERDVQEYQRSSLMGLLKNLGLDYGADTEGYVEIPIECVQV